LIGNHPAAPDKFGEWLEAEDIAVTAKKRHRSLTPLIGTNDADLIEWLADKIIRHHYDEYRLNKLKQKFGSLGFKKYAETHRKLPVADRTKKGNATEIILSEYIESSVGRKMVKAFKLKYNPNVDQAIKGDDTLLVDISDQDKPKFFLGEAKFRKTPTKAVVEDILKSLGKDKRPLSLTYIVDMLAKNPADVPLADKIDDLIIEDIKSAGGLIYTGMLLSNEDTKNMVESHLDSDNPTFVMISIGIEDPEGLINAAFAKADYDLEHNVANL
jgi:succinate dehydrogenase flavin-adding protein (antitoxin of CptAB toxin-antitoxin module)